MEPLARLGNEFEARDPGVTLPHLNVLRGNRSHAPAEFGMVFYPVEFLLLWPLAVTAKENFVKAILSESSVDACLDVPRSWLFYGLENDFPQRCYGPLSHVFPEREENVTCERPSVEAPEVSIEVQLRYYPEWFLC